MSQTAGTTIKPSEVWNTGQVKDGLNDIVMTIAKLPTGIVQESYVRSLIDDLLTDMRLSHKNAPDSLRKAYYDLKRGPSEISIKRAVEILRVAIEGLDFGELFAAHHNNQRELPEAREGIERGRSQYRS